MKNNSLRLFDISVPVSSALPVWPGDSQIILERYRAISKGDASNDSRLACSVHSGTHVDAPAHVLKNGLTVDQLPLDALIGRATVVEFQQADVITPDILAALELPSETTRLLFKTRNSALWADPGHQFNPDFTALNSEAAEWVVRKGIRLIGIDYLSVQMFNENEPSTHSILLDSGVIVVEGLNLQEVQPGNYQLICLPIKLVGGDGAPARAILIEE